MKKSKLFVLGVIGIAVLSFGAVIWFGQNSSNKDENVKAATDPAILIKSHSPVKGNPNANVTIVEFLDPECEACRAMHPIVKQLLSDYDSQIRLVIRYMPFHGNSKFAAAALEEARDQGKYDEALDILFERQPEWADHHQPRPELIAIFLKEIGIDEESLNQPSLLAKHGWKIDLDQSDGMQAGVQRTPTFFVNGKELNEIGYSPLKQAIDQALSAASKQ